MTFAAAIRALDPLQIAVAREFSARYCPRDAAVFLMRFWALFAVFAVAAAVLFFAARRNAHRPAIRAGLFAAAAGVLLFAIGSGLLVFYGLSGCSGAAAEGLIRDWP